LKVAETIEFPPDEQLDDSAIKKTMDRIDIMRILFPSGYHYKLVGMFLFINIKA
jgi:hypothetical protein